MYLSVLCHAVSYRHVHVLDVFVSFCSHPVGTSQGNKRKKQPTDEDRAKKAARIEMLQAMGLGLPTVVNSSDIYDDTVSPPPSPLAPTTTTDVDLHLLLNGHCLCCWRITSPRSSILCHMDILLLVANHPSVGTLLV